MAALPITATRLTVLRAIAAGDVKRYRGWTVNEKTRDMLGGHSGKNVTRTDPRLAVTGRSEGPSIYSPQVWELTDAGRQVLAAHPLDGKP